MFLLEFQEDSTAVAEARAAASPQTHAAVLRWSYLVLRIRFVVGEMDLAAAGPRDPAPHYLDLPILDLATWGLEQLRHAHADGSARYAPSRWPHDAVLLEAANSSLSARVTGSPSGTASYAEALAAWEAFAGHVRAYLDRALPELRLHPFWRRWLGGEAFASLHRELLEAGARQPHTFALRFHPHGDDRQRALAFDLYERTTLPVMWGCFEMELAAELDGAPHDLTGFRIPESGRPPTGPGSWCEFPLALVAGWGLEVVRQAGRDGRAILYLVEVPDQDFYVQFEVSGDQVLLYFRPVGLVWQLPYAQLLQTWEAFADEARHFIAEQTPELLEHELWGAWLRGGPLRRYPG